MPRVLPPILTPLRTGAAQTESVENPTLLFSISADTQERWARKAQMGREEGGSATKTQVLADAVRHFVTTRCAAGAVIPERGELYRGAVRVHDEKLRVRAREMAVQKSCSLTLLVSSALRHYLDDACGKIPGGAVRLESAAEETLDDAVVLPSPDAGVLSLQTAISTRRARDLQAYLEACQMTRLDALRKMVRHTIIDNCNQEIATPLVNASEEGGDVTIRLLGEDAQLAQAFLAERGRGRRWLLAGALEHTLSGACRSAGQADPYEMRATHMQPYWVDAETAEGLAALKAERQTSDARIVRAALAWGLTAAPRRARTHQIGEDRRLRRAYIAPALGEDLVALAEELSISGQRLASSLVAAYVAADVSA